MALLHVSFYSPALRRTVPCDVILPTDKCLPGQPGYVRARPFRTLYLLHGIFGSCHDWVCGTRMMALAQQHDLCVVMPSGDNKFYADSDISGDRYGDFIVKDLVSFTESSFAVSRLREDRFIGGLSMGAFGAVTNALRHPELFSRVLMFSPALLKDQVLNSTPDGNGDFFTDRQYCTLFGIERPADFDGCESDYEMLACRAQWYAPKPEIWMSCGRSDGFYQRSLSYRDLLLSLGYSVSWNEWDGGHTWDFWDESFTRMLPWLQTGNGTEGISSGNVM